MLLNCGAGEDSWESLGQQGDRTSQSQRKSTINVHSKDWCQSWHFNTLATWDWELTHWKRTWCSERLRAGGEGTTEDEVIGWHQWPNGHEFEQILGDSEGQGSLGCCSPWGRIESNTTERLDKNSKHVKTAPKYVLLRPGVRLLPLWDCFLYQTRSGIQKPQATPSASK